ncbi:MAG: DJ-1/PfpI family protein [Bacteroidota bacterium]
MIAIYFLVPPEVQLLDLTGPAHVFYEAREYGANLDTLFVSLEANKEALSSAGLTLGNLKPFYNYELTEKDFLFIPGLESHLFFGDDFVDNHKTFFEWLTRQYQNNAKICSVCTGAYVLGFSGLLGDRNCTTHWKYINDFTSRFPKVKLLSDRLIVKDGNLYSSAGVSSGIDLSLYILEELYGTLFATKIAKEVVLYFRRTANDPQLSVFLQYRNHIETKVHKVQDRLSQNLSERTTIEELAELVYMSPRNLTRLFKKTTGITIGNYLERLRAEKALQLQSKGEKIGAIALAVGLKSENRTRGLLKKYAPAERRRS